MDCTTPSNLEDPEGAAVARLESYDGNNSYYNLDRHTWSIPGFHGVGGPTIVSFLWSRHPGVVLPCFRYHCYDCL